MLAKVAAADVANFGVDGDDDPQVELSEQRAAANGRMAERFQVGLPAGRGAQDTDQLRDDVDPSAPAGGAKLPEEPVAAPAVVFGEAQNAAERLVGASLLRGDVPRVGNAVENVARISAVVQRGTERGMELPVGASRCCERLLKLRLRRLGGCRCARAVLADQEGVGAAVQLVIGCATQWPKQQDRSDANLAGLRVGDVDGVAVPGEYLRRRPSAAVDVTAVDGVKHNMVPREAKPGCRDRVPVGEPGPCRCDPGLDSGGRQPHRLVVPLRRVGASAGGPNRWCGRRREDVDGVTVEREMPGPGDDVDVGGGRGAEQPSADATSLRRAAPRGHEVTSRWSEEKECIPNLGRREGG